MTDCQTALDAPCPPQPPVPLVCVAAALLIDPDQRFLIAQRPAHKTMGGLWEFPGGKLEAGEHPEYALRRELHEELGIDTRPCCFTPLAFVSHSYDTFHLMMPLFSCRAWRGVPRSREGQVLKWIRLTDIQNYEFVPADVPLVHFLLERGL